MEDVDDGLIVHVSGVRENMVLYAGGFLSICLSPDILNKKLH